MNNKQLLLSMIWNYLLSLSLVFFAVSYYSQHHEDISKLSHANYQIAYGQKVEYFIQMGRMTLNVNSLNTYLNHNMTAPYFLLMLGILYD